MRQIALILSYLVAFLLVSVPAHAEGTGTVKLVQNYGYKTLVGKKRRAIYARDDVTSNMGLQTVKNGRIDVKFEDKTQLILGSLSKVQMKNFVFGPKAREGQLSLNVDSGLMRFTPGNMASENYQVSTSSAVIGVRCDDISKRSSQAGSCGTDFIVYVDGNGSTGVYVLNGVVELHPEHSHPSSISAGSTAVTDGKQTFIEERIIFGEELMNVTFGSSSAGNNEGGDGGGGDGGGGC